jgi:hypothetical protein
MDPADHRHHPSAAEAPGSGATAGSSQHWEGVDRAVEIVTVAIFGREYHFKSNRPELVREIAAVIDRLHGQVRTSLPHLPHLTDYPAHVAFSLARDLIKSRREIEELKSVLAETEDRVGDLAEFIELSLGD